MNATSRYADFAVIGAEAVYQSDGRVIPLPQFRQLGYWLDAATRRHIDSLWLHPACGWRWTDDDIATCDPWVVAGSAEANGGAEGEPWWTATKPGTFGVRDVVQPIYEDRAPWRSAPSAALLRDALVAFRDALGCEWRRSPGSTGLRLLRTLHSGAHATRLELPAAPPPPATDGSVTSAGPLIWTRAARAPERRGYLHSYDVNGQYLAACSSLALGVGAWQHITRPQLPGPRDTKAPLLPGYYFVRASEKALAGPLPPILSDDTGVWVTAPTLALLRENRAALHVAECYVWPQSHRYLEPWYKALREARAKLSGQPLASEALKGLYRHGIAWLESAKWDRAEDSLYRPDWAQHIRALALANLQRTVRRVASNYGVYPLAVGSDCVYYVSASPDPLKAPWLVEDGLRLSAKLGQFKVKDSGIPMAEIAEYVRGRDWNLLALQHALNVRAGRRAA